jgi:hypothetical protein
MAKSCDFVASQGRQAAKMSSMTWLLGHVFHISGPLEPGNLADRALFERRGNDPAIDKCDDCDERDYFHDEIRAVLRDAQLGFEPLSGLLREYPILSAVGDFADKLQIITAK